MKKILPDTDDVNNLVRTFQKFSEESGVRITGLKKKADNDRDKGDFTKVAYTISLDADAFRSEPRPDVPEVLRGVRRPHHRPEEEGRQRPGQGRLHEGRVHDLARRGRVQI